METQSPPFLRIFMFESDLVKEAARAGLYSGIQSPLTSLAQLADGALNSAGLDSNLEKAVDLMPQPAPKEFGSSGWVAQTLGGGVGMVLPFIATKGALTRCGLTLASEASMVGRGASLFSSGGAALVADGAISGFAADFIFRPVTSSGDGLSSQLWDRTKNGTVGALTFGTLTAGSITMRQLTNPISTAIKDAPTLLKSPLSAANNFGQGALSGIPAGLVSSEATALSTHGRFATNQERKESVATFMFAGGTLNAFHALGETKLPVERVAKTESAGLKITSPEATAQPRLKYPTIEEIGRMSPEELPRLFGENQRILNSRVESLGKKLPWLAFHGAHAQRSAALFNFFKTGEPHNLEYLFLASPTKIAPGVQSHIGDLAGSLRRATGYGGIMPESNIFVFDVHPSLIKEFYIKETPSNGPEPFAKSKHQGQNDGRLTEKLGTDDLRLVDSFSVGDWAYKPELWGSNLPYSRWLEALSYQSAMDRILGKIEQSSTTPRDWTSHDAHDAMLRKVAEMRRERGMSTSDDLNLIRSSPGNWTEGE